VQIRNKRLSLAAFLFILPAKEVRGGPDWSLTDYYVLKPAVSTRPAYITATPVVVRIITIGVTICESAPYSH